MFYWINNFSEIIRAIIVLISLIYLRKYKLSSLSSCVRSETITGILMCKPCQSIEFVIKEIALKVTLDSDSIVLYNPARLLISLCSAELMMVWVVNTFTRLMTQCHSDPCYSFVICMLNIRFIYIWSNGIGRINSNKWTIFNQSAKVEKPIYYLSTI
jgi:hypothetical protein